MGTAIRFHTQVSDSIALTAEINDIAQARGIAVGDHITLTFSEESAVALAD
jgi:predicted metal-dependent phosphoesterase TrpH